jgi:hypothetical protein
LLLCVAHLDSVALDVSSPVDLRQLAEEVVGSMAHLALSARRTIALTGADQPVFVIGNAAAIEDALRNLIENALVHTAPRTEVVVEVDPAGAIGVHAFDLGLEMLERQAFTDNRCLSRCSGSSEPEVEARPTRGVVAYRYAGAMRPDDLHNDRQTQPGTVGANPLAAPEALEDMRPILGWDARTASVARQRRPKRASNQSLTGQFPTRPNREFLPPYRELNRAIRELFTVIRECRFLPLFGLCLVTNPKSRQS